MLLWVLAILRHLRVMSGERGFSIVEVVAILAIIGIAAAIVIIFLLNNLLKRRHLNDELEAPGAK